MASPLTGTLTAMERERALHAIDVEYIRMEAEESFDDQVMSIFERVAPSRHTAPGSIMPMVEAVSTDDSFRDAEIDVVLSTSHDITMNQLIAKVRNH